MSERVPLPLAAFVSYLSAILVFANANVLAGTPDPARPKIFELAIVNDRLAIANSTLRVKKGDHVQLRWTSDRAMSLHLHGYDIQRDVRPHSTATMSFEARLIGRFPVSEHAHGGRHGRALVYLEVHP